MLLQKAIELEKSRFERLKPLAAQGLVSSEKLHKGELRLLSVQQQHALYGKDQAKADEILGQALTMDIATLKSLLGSPEANQGLKLLADIVVDPDPGFINALCRLIHQPNLVEDTYRFASILAKIPDSRFLDPLAEAIQNARYGNDRWLADYMYALNAVLEHINEPWSADCKLVESLEGWLFETGGGEISWKSAILLSWICNPAAKAILLRGARDTSLFHNTRNYCTRGLVNHFPEDLLPVLAELANDPDPHVREMADDARQWISEDAGKP